MSNYGWMFGMSDEARHRIYERDDRAKLEKRVAAIEEKLDLILTELKKNVPG